MQPIRPAGTPRVVLHVIAPGPIGGAESVVVALAGARAATGAPTHVAALVPSASAEFIDRLRADGVPVHPVVCGHRGYLCEIRAVKAMARRLRPDIVHTHAYRGDLVGYMAARSAGATAIATHHGETGGSLRNRLYEWLDRRLLGRFDAVACVSATGRAWLVRSGIPDHKLHLVPNGHRPAVLLSRQAARARLGLTDERFTVGWVGRLSHEKGADLLIEALADLTGDHIHAVVVGDGPERSALEAAAARLPAGWVTFAGQTSNAASLFAAFDALVLSSRREGLPMVLLEAMSAHVPIIAFSVGGIPEAVTADSAWLVQAGDTRALALAIREAASRPDVARQRADAARRAFAARFAEEGWVAAMERLYDEVRPV